MAWQTIQAVSYRGDSLHELSNPIFSEESKIKMSYADIFTQHVKC